MNLDEKNIFKSKNFAVSRENKSKGKFIFIFVIIYSHSYREIENNLLKLFVQMNIIHLHCFRATSERINFNNKAGSRFDVSQRTRYVTDEKTYLPFFFFTHDLDVLFFSFLCPYLCTDSKQTRRRRTEIYRRVTTWRNFSGCGRGPGKPGPRSGSSDQTASTCSGCARDRIYSSRAPGGRRSGTVPLQTKRNDVKRLYRDYRLFTLSARTDAYTYIYIYTHTFEINADNKQHKQPNNSARVLTRIMRYYREGELCV